VYTMTFYLKTALFSLFFGDSGREYRTRNGLRVFLYQNVSIPGSQAF
jgi:hypothetical protein